MTITSKPTMMKEALTWNQHGFNVIPVHSHLLPVSVDDPHQVGKVALVDPMRLQDRLSYPKEIEQWWQEWPEANIGVMTGRHSGLVVLNVDGQAGAETCQQFPAFPTTVCTRTGQGWHYWFLYPPQVSVGIVSISEGLTLIGDGGYGIVPPSLHASGSPYQWLSTPGTTFAPFPEWLLEYCQPQNSFPPPKRSSWEGTNFHPMRADELLESVPESIDWIWDSFLPVGSLVLISAFMKVGKSTFFYSLLVAIAQGRPFLDFPTKKTSVLILGVEERRQDIINRLRKFGMTATDPIFAHTWRLDHGQSTMDALRDFILKNHIGLLVLDTISRYWNVLDENNNAQIVREVGHFLNLARETGCAVVLVHHDRKSGGEDGRSIRGGSALLGLVDQALMLEKWQRGNDNQRILRSLGRYAETPSELVIELEGNIYRNLGPPDERTRDEKRANVLQALSSELQNISELMNATRLNEKTVRWALADLGDQVLCEGKGTRGNPYYYRLP